MPVPSTKKISSLCIHLTLHLLLFTSWIPSASARFRNNLFVQTCLLTATELNRTDCWVCAQMPAHQGAEFQLQATPANISELFSEHTGRTSNRLSETVLDVQHRASFPVCFQWPARPGIEELGNTTQCLSTVIRSPTDPAIFYGNLPPQLSPPTYDSDSSSPSPRTHDLLTAACTVWVEPYPACNSTKTWEPREDLFWICGAKAYKQLPAVWSGSCALGFVVPAVRVTKERPGGRIRNTRDIQQSIDIVNTYHPLTDLELYGSALVFPQIGVVRVGWAIYRLQAIVELLSNETAELFKTFATEQRELRKVALQNRMALDMILASHGGACALIGTECCVYVPDYSEEIFDHAQHIANLGAMAKDASHEWIERVKEWFGSWWGTIAYYLIMCVVVLISIVIIVKIIICLLSRLCAPPQPANIMPYLIREDNKETMDYDEPEIEVIIALYKIEIE